MNFKELNINTEIVRALDENGIKEPTEIQLKTIPLAKNGQDLIGISKTGSGKTAAFGIPILEKITMKGEVQALIMAPTRELAVQISDELKKWSKYKRCLITTIYGGVSLDPQAEQLAKSDIVVGTPGRMLDHLQRRNLDLTKVSQVVLDEADKMVEMGFIEDVDRILSYTPRDKQFFLFGATISSEIDYLREKHMHQPTVVEVDVYVKEEFLKQFYYDISQHEKFSLLVHLLKNETIDRGIIFCSARNTVELVKKNLRNQSIKAEMIHGKLSQNKRLRVIKDFNEGKVDLLVASAVAARGLHIDGVSHIFNYDLSKDPQEYIHRVGRTARAGKTGKAITLLSPRDHDAFRQILSRYDVPIDEIPKGEFPRLRFETGFGLSRPVHGYRPGQGYHHGHGPTNYGRPRYSRPEHLGYEKRERNIQPPQKGL